MTREQGRRSRAPRLTGRLETIRIGMRELLQEGPATARDLSRELGIPERDVADHLEHLAHSLVHQGLRLVMEPPTCLDCEHAFRDRRRYTRPGRCPGCRGTRISLPVFRIEEKGGRGQRGE